MRPLLSNQRMLIWLCAYSTEGTDEKHPNFSHIAFTVLVFATYVCFLGASIAYWLKFATIDLTETLYATIQITAALPMIKALVITIFLRREFRALFDNLTEIYEANAKEDSFSLLEEVNRKCEWMWEMYMKYVIGGFFVGIISMAAFSVMVSFIIRGEFDEKIAYHPYKFLFPWDQKKLSGYVAEKILDLLIGATYFTALAAVLLLFISLCLNFHTFYKMFELKLQKLKEPSRTGSHADLICSLIRFHSQIKDLFSESADIYSSFVFAQLMCSMLHLACTTFQMDLQMQQLDYGLVFLVQAVMLSGSIMFLYCYFGEMATGSFENVAEGLYEANWQDLPPRLQKYFILMMGNAQIKLYYHGFDVVILSLDTFARLIKTVFSYYMAFKTLTE